MDSQKPSDLYDAYYFATGCGRPYQRDEEWLRFFGSIADRIISDIRPSTVLDAGCAMGFLVEALRQRGVEAFGVDISEYAIQNVHPDIQPYCWVGSVTVPFPQRYDLIVSIEVLEHMPPHEAARTVENFCQHSDDVLFSASPSDYKEPTHFNVRPPEYWAALFACQEFFRDADFDASFIIPWAMRFRRAHEPVTQVVMAYERRLWQLSQENHARRELSIEQRNELAAKEQTVQKQHQELAAREQAIQSLNTRVQTLNTQVRTLNMQVRTLNTQVRGLEEHAERLARRWEHLEGSLGWVVMLKLQGLRACLAPPASVRDQVLEDVLHALRTRDKRVFLEAVYSARNQVSQKAKLFRWRTQLRVMPLRSKTIKVSEIQARPAVPSHQSAVEIIICVHNALSDVQRCLESIVHYTTPPYSLILIDDGSDSQTRDYLAEFAAAKETVLLRNDEAKGYTRAANQGLRHSSTDYVVLLNSDTIVTARWLDRLIACAESDPRIGLVGPLSNTASWQSIPEIETEGDWPENPLPVGITIDDVGQLTAQISARLYPTMPFLNGFCLLIRQQMLQEVGYFDEENFGAGYGEENDYALRARKAGWKLALADDTYIYHAQSRSYSHESRKRLSKRANIILVKKYGQEIISKGVAVCRQDRVLNGIRARSRVVFDRQAWIQKGQAQFEGKRVLFVLPIVEPGGGANVIIDEAMAMQKMGVDVRIFNLIEYQERFEQAYPALEVPVVYSEIECLGAVALGYDAIVATANFTVEWLTSVACQDGYPVRGYYIQDFEPYMYAPGAEGRKAARASYSLFPDLVRFTKTEWTRQEVKEHIGVESALVGVSLNIDLFRPRPCSGPEWPERPLRIAAMVRAYSPYRSPRLTMELLRRAARRYGRRVEIVIFGISLDDPGFAELPRDFAWTLAGVLNRKQVARFLNEVDIFADFSSHQAMGLTALEAMAYGVAVIVPAKGGAVSFARHEENSLVVDTSSSESCWNDLQRLIENHELRSRLQRRALVDVCDYYPERPAFNILRALFDSDEAGEA